MTDAELAEHVRGAIVARLERPEDWMSWEDYYAFHEDEFRDLTEAVERLTHTRNWATWLQIVPGMITAEPAATVAELEARVEAMEERFRQIDEGKAHLERERQKLINVFARLGGTTHRDTTTPPDNP